MHLPALNISMLSLRIYIILSFDLGVVGDSPKNFKILNSMRTISQNTIEKNDFFKTYETQYKLG